jgi:hypothetical protein
MVRDEPITYKELPTEHKQKYDEIKAQFEADLIGSFERTRHHNVKWNGFSPEGALDGVDLSTPSEDRTRALRQEVNYAVAHSLHQHFESLVNAFEKGCPACGPGNYEASILSNGTYLEEPQRGIAIPS